MVPGIWYHLTNNRKGCIMWSRDPFGSQQSCARDRSLWYRAFGTTPRTYLTKKKRYEFQFDRGRQVSRDRHSAVFHLPFFRPIGCEKGTRIGYLLLLQG